MLPLWGARVVLAPGSGMMRRRPLREDELVILVLLALACVVLVWP